jgi:hypothetical protein
MAAQRSDWLSTDEAIISLEASLSLTSEQADEVLRRFIHEGLLTAAVRRHDSQVVTGVQFSYQRFGDHLIARHLLDAHLVMTSEESIRRCFYRNRPLGHPFRLDRWGHQFEEPGIAAALMLEFPERMKRSPLSHELLTYLPRARQRVSPVKDVFLHGLYWRSADAFTEETDRLIGFFLTQLDDWARDETFEVLVGLATRPSHPLAAKVWPTTSVDKRWHHAIRRGPSTSGDLMSRETFNASLRGLSALNCTRRVNRAQRDSPSIALPHDHEPTTARSRYSGFGRSGLRAP